MKLLLILLSFYATTFIACNENKIISNNSNIRNQESMPIKLATSFGDFYFVNDDGYMFLTTNKVKGYPNDHYIKIISGLDGIYGGEMILADVHIPWVGDGYYLPMPKEYDSSNKNMPTYGKESLWELSGNDSINFPGFSVQMYVPQILFNQSPELGDYQYLSISDNVKISWNADSLNKKGVWIWFYYDTTKSGGSEDFYWYKNVPDNGEYIFELTKLKIPDHGVVEFVLIRFNEQIITAGDFTIPIRAQSYMTSFNQLKE